MARRSVVTLIASFVLALPAFCQQVQPIDLTARVGYARAIEEVYWRQRIWPQQNSTAKPPLGAMISAEQLQARAEDALRLSNAIEKYWHAPITAQQLQAEVVRMVQNTRQPEVLRQLFSALDNNPRLIAEVLARPLLAERLARGFYEQDARLAAGQPFETWWGKVRGNFFPALAESTFAYILPAITATAGPATPESWSPTFALPEADVSATAVWTGAEMIVWGGTEVGGGRFNSGSRYNPATDTWRSTSGAGAPRGRMQHTAVWTGTEMIVWGGCSAGVSEHACESNDGGRYNPATDTWISTRTSGAPTPRINHGAVWTGTEMIVWGGCAFTNDVCRVSVTGSTGGRYIPATDTWTLTNTTGAPTPRILHSAVWTGHRLIVWGGYDNTAAVGTGAVYNPGADSWSAMAAAPLNSARYDHSTVWTGREMIIWGGFNGSKMLRTGALYSLVQNRWRPVPTTGAPTARYFHAGVWTGTEMVIWGGGDLAHSTNTGGRYSPTSNTWTPTSTLNAPVGRWGPASVWSGSLMLIWGGQKRTGGRYDPASDTWTPTNALEPPSAREAHSAVWTGTEMILWGGDDRFNGTVSTGGRYNLATDSWAPTALANAPSPRHLHTAVWTGNEMIIWGGAYGSTITKAGGRYNPVTNTWIKTATAGAPEGRDGHSMVWTGTEMIIFGGSVFNSPWSNSGGRYNPSTDSWTTTSTVNAPTPRSEPLAVWSGNQMIVWGGGTANFETNTGGRYDPATNSWKPISQVNALSPRFGSATAWTGSRMLLWGGTKLKFPSAVYNDGALYDPVGDTWIPISMTGAPSARAGFSDVWTGTDLIVWGGDNSGVYEFSGARYNPASDTWTDTQTVGAPSPRVGATAVWSGNQMIVWGGFDAASSTYTFTGGVYTPGR